MEEAKYKCYYTWCDKSFNGKYNLKRHINALHIGLKRFECNLCGKKLSSKQNLTEHLFTHEGVKPYECRVPGCGKVYRQSSQLSFHKTRAHADLKDREEKTSATVFKLEDEKRAPSLPEINLERRMHQEYTKLQVHHLLLR